VTDPAAAPGGEGVDTWRSRAGDAATRRGVPLATIVTTVVVAVLVIDVNALVILVLWVLRSLILSLLLAGFVAVLLSAPVHFLERRGMRRTPAAVVVTLVAVVVFVGILAAFTAPLVEQVTAFANKLPTLVKQAEHGKGWVGHLVTRFHLQRFVQHNLPKLTHNVLSGLKPAQALSVGKAAISTVVTLSLIAVLAFFLLIEGPALWGSILRTMSPQRAARVAHVYHESSRSVTGYMFGNALTSIIAGIIVFITLTILGVPFAPLLGVWVGLVDLLPLVGGLLAGAPVIVIATLHSVTAGIIMAIVFLAYQLTENHVLNPVIMSRTVRLNPLWVMLSVVVGAALGGRVGSGLGAFVGALLGIPIGGAIQVAAREIRRGPSAGAPPGEEALADAFESSG
jgi:predicted PurR-regulated permease PerM